MRPVSAGAGQRWQAAVWVRDLDGRRRLVRASGRDLLTAEAALDLRLDQRRPLGFRGVDPQMSVQQLGEYWMRRRSAEMSPPVEGQARGSDQGAVSAQTLAGYQTALSRIINPHLGGLRLVEARTGLLDEVLAGVDLTGRSTRVARSVLTQMFAMAVRHDALVVNPMREVRRCPRRRREVQALTLDQARELLRMTAAHQSRVARDAEGVALGGPRRTPDLHDLVVLLLGTGMRIGEGLALEWSDVDLVGEVPSVRVAATIVEPRRDAATGLVFVAVLHRQPTTKTGTTRTVALPEAAAAMLRRRRRRAGRRASAVFTDRDGGWLWPNNVRAKLRGVLAGTDLAGITPHTLRRTVATMVAYEDGLDAASDLLGHRHPSVAARHYIAPAATVIDARHALEPIFIESSVCISG